MQRYILLRIGTGFLTLIGVALIVFSIMRIVPGDPALMALEQKYGEGWADFVTDEMIEMERARMGTDQPIPTQFYDWICGLLRLDMGNSYLSGLPVRDIVAEAIPLTLQVNGLAIIIAATYGVSMGMLAAVKQYTIFDYASRVLVIAGISMPTFFTATLVIFGLLKFFNWLPPIGLAYFWVDPAKALQQVWAPSLILGYYLAAITARMTRSQMLEILREDYIRTAYSKGLAQRVVFFRHALRNAVLPVVTIVGSSFSHVLGGSVIIESIFNINGMGLTLVEALRGRDFIVVQDIILLIAGFVVFVNLLVDLTYAVLDPRIRYR